MFAVRCSWLATTLEIGSWCASVSLSVCVSAAATYWTERLGDAFAPLSGRGPFAESRVRRRRRRNECVVVNMEVAAGGAAALLRLGPWQECPANLAVPGSLRPQQALCQCKRGGGEGSQEMMAEYASGCRYQSKEDGECGAHFCVPPQSIGPTCV